jgi:hypothetical protein
VYTNYNAKLFEMYADYQYGQICVAIANDCENKTLPIQRPQSSSIHEAFQLIDGPPYSCYYFTLQEDRIQYFNINSSSATVVQTDFIPVNEMGTRTLSVVSCGKTGAQLLILVQPDFSISLIGD